MPANGNKCDWGTVALDLLLSCAALAVLLTSVLLAPAMLPDIPLCQFNQLTGLPCAGCGATRAFCAIGHGDFTAAWDYNPLSFILYAGTVALLVWPLVRRRIPGIEKRIVLSPWFGGTAVAVIALTLVFGVARMMGELSVR